MSPDNGGSWPKKLRVNADCGYSTVALMRREPPHDPVSAKHRFRLDLGLLTSTKPLNGLNLSDHLASPRLGISVAPLVSSEWTCGQEARRSGTR